LQGLDIADVEVQRCGVAGDRRWMVVDEGGQFITQRECPTMARIAAMQQTAGLMLQTAGQESIGIPRPTDHAEQIQVTVWRSTLWASHAGSLPARWISEALGIPCRLVYLADPGARPVDPDYGQPQDRVSFADGFPVLLTATASLNDLNRRVAPPVPMRRFRPNLVVTGSEPWAEDTWRRIRIGEVIFEQAKSCSRCSVTSVDQATGERPFPREPLRTLATFRRTQAGSMFGQNMIPRTLGRIAVGDPVTVLETGPSNVIPEPERT
jgi:uncharacterized protein